MAEDSDITTDAPQPDSALQKAGGAIPGVKQYLNSAKVIEDAIKSDEVTAGNALATVTADIASLGLEAYAAFKDPLSMLINVGLDFVLAFVEPANKLLTWLSGDPGKMGELQGWWREIKNTLLVLREEVDAAWESSLQNSQSPTTDAAKDKVSGMIAAIAGVAAAIAQIESHVGTAQMLSKAIYELIKAMLSALVEQLIIYGLTALALSSTTFGGSIASFLMWAGRKAGVDIMAMLLKVQLAKFAGKQLSLIGSEVLASTFRQSSAEMLQWAGGMVSNIVGGVQGTGAPGRGGPGGGSSNPSGDMANYTSVEPEEFNVAAGELKRLQTNADSLSTAVNTNTETDFWTWGIACQGWVEGYNEQRVEIAGDVALISPALEGNATRFEQVATAYEDADIQAAEDIKVAGGK